MALIIFTAGPKSGLSHPLPDEDGLTIGRSRDATLQIVDAEVSSRHARLMKKDGAWWLFDLQSSNGTTVNGVAAEARRLNDGDVVGLGPATRFTFRSLGEDGGDGGGGNGGQTAPAATPPPEATAPTPREPTDTARRPAGAPVAGAPAGSATVASRAAAPYVPPPPPPEASAADVALVREMSRRTDAIRAEVGKVIVGQREVLDQVLMCMIARGHGLLIGLPGMAKTLMVSTVAKVLDLSFKRIQFTPDLMPTDITGTDVLETNKETNEKEFRFIKGPIFCNLLLADEINRTPPKTQSALLEAMQEKKVTAGNQTFTLEEPFFVLATQNPIEQEGTYPLPEAQLDRFMFNIWVDYPLEHEEEQIVGTTTSGTPTDPVCVMTREELLHLQEVVRKIPVSEHVIKYVIRLVRATRPGYPASPEITRTYVSTGAGPRAGQFLTLAAKARAVLDGRIHVSCNDIRQAAVPVLRHRILTNFAADSEGLRPMDIVNKLLAEIPEPTGKDYR